MTLLTATELADMRTVVESMLPGTCTIQNRSISRDSIGGGTATWANAATSVACKLAPERAIVGGAGGQVSVHSGWVMSVPFDQTITAGQRVVYNSDNFEVVSVEDDHDFRVVRRVYLRRSD